jgi:hypothetical protein
MALQDVAAAFEKVDQGNPSTLKVVLQIQDKRE